MSGSPKLLTRYNPSRCSYETRTFEIEWTKMVPCPIVMGHREQLRQFIASPYRRVVAR
jgi:hypothetical protein